MTRITQFLTPSGSPAEVRTNPQVNHGIVCVGNQIVGGYQKVTTEDGKVTFFELIPPNEFFRPFIRGEEFSTAYEVIQHLVRGL